MDVTYAFSWGESNLVDVVFCLAKQRGVRCDGMCDHEDWLQ